MFSPDGKTIAFSAQYDGNTDVYTVPVDRRRADAADVASRRRRRPGLHAGRQGGPVHLAARDVHRPLRAALHRAGRRRDGGAAADPERGARHLLARRPAHRLQPAPAALRSSGSTTAAARSRGSGSTTRRATRSRRSRSRRTRSNDTDPMWIGDTVYFRSDRNGEFNLFAYDTKGEAGPAAHDVTTTSRCSTPPPAAGGSSTNRPAACTCSTRQPGKRDAAEDRRRLRPARDARRVRARARAGSATRRCRRPARARRSSSAARSSPCPARRATSATSPTAAARTTAIPAWSPDGTLDRLVLRRVAASTSSTSAARTARASRARSRSPAPASTAIRSGRPTRRRSPTSTTR